MKAGDLVELSSYARKLKMFSDFRGKVGLVVEVEDRYRYFYTVLWPTAAPLTFYRRDLKYVK